MPLGIAHSNIHLYHESKPPIIVYNEAQAAAAMVDKDGKPTGYGRSYIPQAYPKAVTRGDGVVVTCSCAAEEKAVLEAK